MSLDVQLAHDYITQKGGAERVVLELSEHFESASVHTLLYDRETTFPEFGRVDVKPSALNLVPLFRRNPEYALPALPLLARQRMPIDCDILLCSSSGWSHGFRTTGKKIVYCHNPPRWLYQSSDFLKGRSGVVKCTSAVLSPYLRNWDQAVAQEAVQYVANSTSVRERIRQAYGIEAEVIYPPVSFSVSGDRDEVEGVDRPFFLTVGRPRGYKNTETIIEAFRLLPDFSLVVVGAASTAAFLGGDRFPPNVRLVGSVSDSQLRWLYENSLGLVAMSREDFGLTPIEANLFGKPVLALRAGGYVDTVVSGRTGILVDRVAPQVVADGVKEIAGRGFSADQIREHSRRFAPHEFFKQLDSLIARQGD